MDAIYVFIKKNDIIIYIIAGLALFWYLSDFFRAQRLLKRAVFGLEKEKGAQIRNNALFFIVLLISVIGSVYYINYQIIPTLPSSLFVSPTATPDIFRTPPPTLGPRDTVVPSPIPPLVPTITLLGNSQLTTPPPGVDPAVTANSEVTSTPFILPTPVIDCNVLLNFSQPRNGTVAAGAIIFNGSANMNDFGSYSLEANGPQTNGQWASLLGREINQPVIDGFLGEVNLSQWENGPYLIRLSGVNADQSQIQQCVIQITLEN